jgi:hypothetical protein
VSPGINACRATEQEIGRRNLSRIPYETLLPTAIPQSINIQALGHEISSTAAMDDGVGRSGSTSDSQDP